MGTFSIEKASKRQTSEIQLESMGGDIARIIEMTADQAYQYQLSMVDKTGQPDFSKMRDAAPWLISVSVVDAEENPVMDKAQAKKLRQKVSDELVKKINEFNKIDTPEEKKDSAPES